MILTNASVILNFCHPLVLSEISCEILWSCLSNTASQIRPPLLFSRRLHGDGDRHWTLNVRESTRTQNSSVSCGHSLKMSDPRRERIIQVMKNRASLKTNPMVQVLHVQAKLFSAQADRLLWPRDLKEVFLCFDFWF